MLPMRASGIAPTSSTFSKHETRNKCGESPMRSAHSSKHSVLRRLVISGAVLATVAGIGAGAARADDGYGYRSRGDRPYAHEHWRHEEARREAWREREWRERHTYYAPRYYYPHDYAYAPRPVYPPPAYVEPGVNLGFYFR
jgi:hypothetical protein